MDRTVMAYLAHECEVALLNHEDTLPSDARNALLKARDACDIAIGGMAARIALLQELDAGAPFVEYVACWSGNSPDHFEDGELNLANFRECAPRRATLAEAWLDRIDEWRRAEAEGCNPDVAILVFEDNVPRLVSGDDIKAMLAG